MTFSQKMKSNPAMFKDCRLTATPSYLNGKYKGQWRRRSACEVRFGGIQASRTLHIDMLILQPWLRGLITLCCITVLLQEQYHVVKSLKEEICFSSWNLQMRGASVLPCDIGIL